MLQCFISHCSDDRESVVKPLDEILSRHFPRDKHRFFCSSLSGETLMPGAVVGDALKKELQGSGCMIAVVTDNYLRSPISLTELSSMWFTHNAEEIIPLVFSPEAEKYLGEKFISNLVYLNAMDRSRAGFNADAVIRGLKRNGFVPGDETALWEELTGFFSSAAPEPSARAYIGSGEVYANINRFCAENGVRQILRSALSHEEVKSRLADKTEIYLVMTTGSSFIENFSKEYLQRRVADGCDVYMILPNRSSDFCRDVAFIEAPADSRRNLSRLSGEFDTVVRKLKLVLEEARELQRDPARLGHVYLCPAYNLLRQTICLGRNKKGDCWGWMTTTIPPARATGSTPTIVFDGKLSDRDFLGCDVYRHVSRMAEVARLRGGLVDLAEKPDFTAFDSDSIVDLGERAEIEKEWEKKYKSALRYMQKRQGGSKVLIEIAAQHPLDGERPGAEFAARLDYGFDLYNSLSRSGKDVRIYVPGSVHMADGVVDPISLSEAGCRYLKELGVPAERLYGEPENLEYMEEMGVYNSCDECFVSAKIFNNDLFSTLHCVCSPNQAVRKQLFYLNFGVIPYIHTVPGDAMYHRLTEELFHSVPAVLYKYPNWSDPDCPMFRKSRLERMPGYRID